MLNSWLLRRAIYKWLTIWGAYHTEIVLEERKLGDYARRGIIFWEDGLITVHVYNKILIVCHCMIVWVRVDFRKTVVGD